MIKSILKGEGRAVMILPSSTRLQIFSVHAKDFGDVLTHAREEGLKGSNR